MDERRQQWGYALLLFAVSVIIYSNALDGPFFLDDLENIVQNPAVHELWPLTRALFPPPSGMGYHTRPIVNLTMCVNYAIGRDRPRVYHVTNIALHGLAVVVLFALTSATLRTSGCSADLARLLAFGAALLWAVHPLASSAVNYVSQRGEQLVALALLTLLLCLHRSVFAASDRKRAAWAFAGAFVCLVGMGSKESMAVAPFLALGFDRVYLATSWQEIWQKRKLFYLALFLTIAWPVSLQLSYSPHVPPGGYNIEERWRFILLQAWGIVRMIRLSLWPRPLIADYGLAMPGRLSQVWGEFLVVLVALAWTVWALKHRPRLGFISLAAFLWLAPSSTLFPVLGQPLAEHRMYGPLIAVPLLASLGVYALIAQRVRDPAAHKRWYLAAIALIAAILGRETWQRNQVYQDVITLWADTLKHHPGNWRVWNNYGHALIYANRWDEAERAFRKAVELVPGLPLPYYNLAYLLHRQGRFEEAIEAYRNALRADPLLGWAHNGLAVAYADLKRYDEAIAEHELALATNPRDPRYHFSYATTLMALQRYDEAVTHLTKAVDIKPDYVEAWSNLGNCYMALQQNEQAVEAFQQALRLDPSSLPAAGNLGLLYAQQGRSDDALRVLSRAADAAPQPTVWLAEFAHGMLNRGLQEVALGLYREILRRQPEHVLALNNSAWIMATSTNPALRNAEEAIRNAERVVAQVGNSVPSALTTLAAAYAEAGRFDEAQEILDKAAALAAADTNALARIEQQRASYQRNQPWRE